VKDYWSAMSDPNSSAEGPRVWFVSAAVGGGHNSAARALMEQLAREAPHVRCELVDMMSLVPGAFRAYYAGGFALAMTRLPWAYGLGFHLTNRPHCPRRSFGERLRLAWERWNTGRFAAKLLRDRPALIVHTHFLAPPVVARLVAAGRADVPQAVVVTDNDVHRWWYSEGVEQWFLPNDDARATLDRWGIAPQRVAVCGIPIHPKWIAPVDREKVLAEWRLPTDRKIVLLSGGTEFTCGPVVKIARRIVAARADVCVVVLAGRNKKLLARLAATAEARDGRIVPQGFTDRLHELAEVASLMLTKPGGVTTSECLSKGLPMVLMNPVPGQEGANAEYFRRAGTAVVAKGAGEIVRAATALLDDPEATARMSDCARRLYRQATQTVTEWILNRLGSPR